MCIGNFSGQNTAH